jgi:hypothetical protein
MAPTRTVYQDGTKLRIRPLPQAVLWLVLGLWLPGCGDDSPQSAPTPSPSLPEPVAPFDPTAAGIIEGQVTWTGALPEVPPLTGWTDPAPDGTGAHYHCHPNPNAPLIDASSRGVGNAIVLLRGLEGKPSRPWDHPPVRVEQHDYRLRICQGGPATNVGFVPQGSRIEMISTERVFHALHAEGAAYFTLAFPDAGQPSFRTLDHPGLVELTSAAGYFWMHAYLFVGTHPYYARCDAMGHFTLRGVPPGRYQVVCWLPNWREAGHDRDAETALVTRLRFRSPVEKVIEVVVEPRGTCRALFTLGLRDF